MKLGKKSKTADIENPIRPQNSIPKSYTSCRITKDTKLNTLAEYEYSIQVDGDSQEDFEKYLKSLPKNSYYRDKVLEMWFVKEEFYEELVRKAFDCYKKVIVA